MNEQQFDLPIDLPEQIPDQVEKQLWRVALGMRLLGKEITLNDFASLARVVARQVKRGRVLRGDAAAWLNSFGVSRDFAPDKVQLAIELAFEVLDDDEASEERPLDFSDDALASEFAERHADHLRFVAAWGRWLIYDRSCWREDTTLDAFDMAREICREAAAAPNKASVRTALASAKTVSAIERLAKADRRLAATVDQWDSDAMLLNTPGGIVDLRTGKLRTPVPSDYMTKITAVAPGGDCPIWQGFLTRITDGDPDLQRFLQTVMGYSITGLTSEHALFFGYGTGANGKSVLINTVAEIMGSYHRTAPIEAFTASVTEHHPTDIAGLRGARLVTSVETEEGRCWAEAKIKNLTGGDKISARFMRQDFFEFVPQFKLIIAGNHRPGLKSVDEAIRRRFHLIPFAVTIPPEERDKDLAEKLKAEWGGILAWMLDGCVAWQRDGLCPPLTVTEATAAYLDAEDALATWIAEACERDPQAFTPIAALFASWAAWAERSGEYVGSQRRFSDNLEAKGFTRMRAKTGENRSRGFLGLKVAEEVWN